MEMTIGIEKTAQYHGFNLYGGCEPYSENTRQRESVETDGLHRLQVQQWRYQRAETVSFSNEL